MVRGGRIDVGSERGDVTLSDGTSAALHPLGEGVLAIAGPSRDSGTPRLRLCGHPRASFFTPTAEHRLTVRHSQIAELLARHPDGLDARELSQLLYGEDGHEVAVRSELHRLREILGPALATRPYRLQGVVTDLDEPDSATG